MAVYRNLFFKNNPGAPPELVSDDRPAGRARTRFANCPTPSSRSTVAALRISTGSGRNSSTSFRGNMLPNPTRHPSWRSLSTTSGPASGIRLNGDASSQDSGHINPEGDLLDCPLVLSPTSELCVYAYPVHRIKPDFQPQQKPETPTFLFAFRSPAGKARFMELNPATARLLALLKDQPDIPARSQLDRIARTNSAGKVPRPCWTAGGRFWPDCASVAPSSAR